MRCPYCEIEMTSGKIAGDGRAPFVWLSDHEEKKGFLDRLTTTHPVLAEAKIFKRTTLNGYKCKVCNKIIIDLNSSNK